MIFLENIYMAISILSALMLPLLLTIMQILFDEKRLHKATYKTLVAAALSISVSLFFKYVAYGSLDAALFLSKMAEINFASLVMYAFIIERSPMR